MKKQDSQRHSRLTNLPKKFSRQSTTFAAGGREKSSAMPTRLGAEFTYRYKNMHKSTQQITEFIPGKKVVWHVTDAELTFVKDKTEWIGTDIVFEIARKGGKTELHFTHVGLVPAFECYGGCSGAWGVLVGRQPAQSDHNGQKSA